MNNDTEDDVESEIEDDVESEPDGDIYIVPTSHVSENSSKRVHEVVDIVKPNMIAVELDDKRFQRLISEEKKSDMSVKDILTKSGLGLKGSIMLIAFNKFQSIIVDKLGIDIIGLDMLAGYEASSEHDIPLALVDQNMQITFERFTNEITFRELFKMLASFVISYIHLSRKSKNELSEQVDVENIDIDESMEYIEDIFPTFNKVFLQERNQVIAQKTAEIAKDNDRTVLVIGAAHESGIRKIFKEQYDNVHVREVSKFEFIDSEDNLEEN